jgi:hypothetical protein
MHRGRAKFSLSTSVWRWGVQPVTDGHDLTQTNKVCATAWIQPSDTADLSSTTIGVRANEHSRDLLTWPWCREVGEDHVHEGQGFRSAAIIAASLPYSCEVRTAKCEAAPERQAAATYTLPASQPGKSSNPQHMNAQHKKMTKCAAGLGHQAAAIGNPAR